MSLGAQAMCGTAGAPQTPPPLVALPPAPPRYDAPSCWGTNGAGQFANGSAAGSRLAPTNVSSTVWQQISLSDTTACGIQRGVLALYCWGTDYGWGSLGDGTATSHYVPLQVSGGGQWNSVFAGSSWGCGIRTNGSLYCWGYNRYGSVGDGTTPNRWTPVLVTSTVTWTTLPLRGYSGFFTCGIQTDSSLWCWVRAVRSTSWARLQCGWTRVEFGCVP